MGELITMKLCKLSATEAYTRMVEAAKKRDKGETILWDPSTYKNTRSIVQVNCPTHGPYRMSYNDFMRNRGCQQCAREKTARLNGFCNDKKKKKDYLYVLIIDDVVKIGRAFNVQRRIAELYKKSNATSIKIHSLYTARHSTIYAFEQFVLEKATELQINANVDWSSECIVSDRLPDTLLLIDSNLEDYKVTKIPEE